MEYGEPGSRVNSAGHQRDLDREVKYLAEASLPFPNSAFKQLSVPVGVRTIP